MEKQQDMKFGQVIAQLRDEKDLAESLRQVLAAVRETGKPGKLTYTINIKPADKGDVSAVFVQDDVTVKLPKPERQSKVFFVTKDNRLTRSDPAQPQLPMKELEEDDEPTAGAKVVEAVPAQPKEVNG